MIYSDSDGDVLAAVKGEVHPKDLIEVAIEAKQCHFHSPSESSIDGKKTTHWLPILIHQHIYVDGISSFLLS